MSNAIPHQRMHNQYISHHPFTDPVDLVVWLGALQGQDYAGAKWSIGLRIPDATDAQIEQAIADRRIVRTWLMRGTLHLVSAADARWMTELLAPHLIASNARRYRELALDAKTLDTARDLIAQYIAAYPDPVDRPTLLAHVEAGGISTEGQRGVYSLQYASLKGVIAQAGMRGKDMLFVPMPEGGKSPDNAAAELARRYFQSRSPATLKDFTYWSGLPAADARAAVEAIKSSLIEETIDGNPYLRVDSPAQFAAPHPVLLPAFDEYLLGYTDRDAVLDPAYAKQVFLGGGMFSPAFTLDGQILGTWKRAIKKDTVTITLSPFGDLTSDEREQLSGAADQYARFLGLSHAVI